MKSNIDKIKKIKFDFSFPTKRKVIIFDKNGENLLKQIIKEKYDIIYSRNEKINFFLTIITLINFFFKIIKNKKFFLYYYIQTIKFHKPKLVITYIDNNLIFYKLKKNFKNVNFIAIQNGYRFYEDDLFLALDKQKIKIVCDKYFCFGPLVKSKLKDHLNGQISPPGSLKNNICSNKETSSENTICFISAYGVSDFRSEPTIIKTLIDFCNKRKIQISVLPRRNNINEKIFYENIFQSYKFLYVEKNLDNICSSYNYLDSCLISISINGTLGYENLSRSNKTFFINCNNRGIENLHLQSLVGQVNFKMKVCLD